MNWLNSLPGKLLSERVLILDGAMGTMIQRYSPSFPSGADGNNDLLVLTQPALIQTIHEAYVQAGADIITTNTFNANTISQQEYGTEDKVYQMNRTAVALARAAGARLVAGSIGPTNKSASLSPDVNNPGLRAVDFNTLVEAYAQQVRGLRDGETDLFLVETVFDTINAKAALFAITREAPDIPVMLSATVADAGGRILSGQTLDAFLVSVRHANLFSIGLNCSFGADAMLPFIRTFVDAPLFVSAHPNAGLPDMFGKYTQTPEIMARTVRPFVEEGLVNIIGGCCGTTPDHIAAIARMVRSLEAPVRKIPLAVAKKWSVPSFSGLEPLRVQDPIRFLNVGERTNVAGSRKFARLIKEKNYGEALDIARRMVDDGAHIIDVNMDDPMLDAPVAMREFLLLLGSDPAIARVPVMIDSSRWEALEAGLQCVQGKSIVNSISLKEGKDEFLRKAQLIKHYGAAVVVMAFDEEGQATTLERRKAICARAYEILTREAGFNPTDILFDPNILTIATGMQEHRGFAVDFIETVRYIKNNLPGALVSGGVSNLSFAFRGNDTVREAMHTVFLYHAIAAGLDMAIIKPGAQPAYDDIAPELRKAVEDAVLDSDEEATTRLVEVASRIAAGTDNKPGAEMTGEAWRSGTPSERLTYALMHGIEKYLGEDLAETGAASGLDIVEGPLMEGMTRVGKLFGEGKMFLPQVVRTARVMKRAVALLQPRMQAEKEKALARGNAREAICGIIATVKGDVHDIGKNLVAVVMECNHYCIIDLGVMVPTHRVVEAALEHKAQFVGLSGLITPSLEEMVVVARAMRQAGLTVPLLIGGATTSEEFTALRIAPEYNGLVLHCADAARNITYLSRYFSKDSLVRDAFVKEVRASQEKLRRAYELKNSNRQLLSVAEARANKWVDDEKPDTTDDFVPPFTGKREMKIPFALLRPLINWTAFLSAWEMNSKASEKEGFSKQSGELLADAGALLDELIAGKYGDVAFARAVAGFWPVSSTSEDHILFYADDSLRNMILDLPMERDLLRREDNQPNLCLSDFVVQAEHGHKPGYAGLFVITASSEFIEKQVDVFNEEGDIYRSLLLKSLLDRMAEACSEYLHRVFMPAPGGGIRGIRPAFGYPSCPDHSLKKEVMAILEAAESLGVRLTSSCMIEPGASLCGMYLGHHGARYFSVHK